MKWHSFTKTIKGILNLDNLTFSADIKVLLVAVGFGFKGSLDVISSNVMVSFFQPGILGKVKAFLQLHQFLTVIHPSLNHILFGLLQFLGVVKIQLRSCALLVSKPEFLLCVFKWKRNSLIPCACTLTLQPKD